MSSLIRLEGELSLDEEVEHQAGKECHGGRNPQIHTGTFVQQRKKSEIDGKGRRTDNEEFDQVPVAHKMLNTPDEAHGTIPHDSKIPPVLVGLPAPS
ncbi:hypothetical protein QK292_13585 [Arthrobacter sp. AL08]|nr:hypothetical protein [Arthrobacter sp. AL08]